MSEMKIFLMEDLPWLWLLESNDGILLYVKLVDRIFMSLCMSIESSISALINLSDIWHILVF